MGDKKPSKIWPYNTKSLAEKKEQKSGEHAMPPFGLPGPPANIKSKQWTLRANSVYKKLGMKPFYVLRKNRNKFINKLACLRVIKIMSYIEIEGEK